MTTVMLDDETTTPFSERAFWAELRSIARRNAPDPGARDRYRRARVEPFETRLATPAERRLLAALTS